MEAARETGLPVWLGVSCRFATNDASLVGFDYPDVPFTEPLNALLPFEPDAVNVMHTEPDTIAAALGVVTSQWSGAVGVYPELGDFQMPNWNFTSRLTPADLAEKRERGWNSEQGSSAAAAAPRPITSARYATRYPIFARRARRRTNRESEYPRRAWARCSRAERPAAPPVPDTSV